MQNETKNSRRKFVAWAAAIVSGLSLVTLGIRSSRKNQMVKMLTQDGRLVEVDRRLLTGNKKKVSTNDLKHWVKGRKI
jgi:hypothetical protein